MSKPSTVYLGHRKFEAYLDPTGSIGVSTGGCVLLGTGRIVWGVDPQPMLRLERRSVRNTALWILLHNLKACYESRRWIYQRQFASPGAAWRAADRADWLRWLAIELTYGRPRLPENASCDEIREMLPTPTWEDLADACDGDKPWVAV